MFSLKDSYYCIIISFLLTLLSCKQEQKKTELKNTDIETTSFLEPNFSYENLVGKTFLPVYEKEDGTYEYKGDITKEDDMGEDRIRFRKDKIKHLIPIEWQDYPIVNVSYKNEWLKLNLVGNLSDIKDKRSHFSYYFKYNKKTNLLKYCVVPNEDIQVFIDSSYVVLLESKKPVVKKENPFKKHVVYKESKISIGNKNVKIKLPFVKEHNYNGDKIFGSDEISNELEVKLLKGSKEDLFFVFGEGMCGACPNFSAIYDMKGNNLSYGYSIRMNSRESKTLISKGDEDKIFADYGFSDRDINIQINHADTPTYVIKNWH